MPAYKALFFLGKGREPREKLGQKCEVVDRKGQNSLSFGLDRISDGKADRECFPIRRLVELMKVRRVFSLSSIFQPD